MNNNLPVTNQLQDLHQKLPQPLVPDIGSQVDLITGKVRG